MRVFVDANVPMYAAGRSHAFKDPSADFMMAVGRRRVDAVSDVEVLQEILHRYRSVGRATDGSVVFEAFATAVRLFHPIVLEDLWECRRILARHEALRPRDAIHVAVMRRTGIRTIVSYDRHFDEVPGIDRVTPDAVP
ncbi:MAG: type II toxin-antitoxin system VapC family toxin [Acidobacteria bacterium]|nr:type II toxin-antitoxin system VapC family toxin [Acidobacteriota bacterium]